MLLPSFLALAQKQPTVFVTGGEVQGRMQGAAAVFRGIPFAKPPVGDFRWREPQPLTPWAGIRQAVEPGPPCTQRDMGWNKSFAEAGREDCLYLDVWAPAWPPQSGQAVMVWIHGGANAGGAGGFDPLYHGAALVSHNVVLVLIQYRVGVFGFFAHPELTRESPHHSSGNYGILDQIAALQWVRDNIAKFGGDPGNVTVFGQSAGSADAMFLMTSPLSKGLLHRVIGESGGALSARHVPTLKEAEEQDKKFVKGSADSLKVLRSMPAADLLKAARGPNDIDVDGWVFKESPANVFIQGKEHRIPLLLGTNAIEFPAQGSPDELRRRIEADYGDVAPKMLEFYGLSTGKRPVGNDPAYGTLNDQVGTDAFRCAVALEGEYHSRAGNPTWEYQFDRAIPPHANVGHSSELPYVFGNLYSEGSQAGNFQEADRKLSAAMQLYWTNFAKGGDPNGEGTHAWPSFNEKGRNYLNFTSDGSIAEKQNQREGFCSLYREWFKKNSLRQ